jgi:hypothetical protein
MTALLTSREAATNPLCQPRLSPALSLAQQPRQLGDVRRNPSRLIPSDTVD